MSRTVSAAQNITLHQVLADWGEGTSNASANEGSGAIARTGDATWRHRFFSNDFWTNEGGDFDATVSATASVNAIGNYSWSGAGLVDDVRSWIADPTKQFGWILVGNESQNGQSKRFDSRQNVIAANRPVLEIVFSESNAAPTDIQLNPAAIAEAGGSVTPRVVGTLSATDADTGDTHTFSLAAGTGDSDNGQFEIQSGTLRLRAGVAIDRETTSVLHVRVAATDSKNARIEKEIDVAVTNVNESPTLTGELIDPFFIAQSAVSLQLPLSIFSDVDGDQLTWSAKLADGGALPAWLSFDGPTRTFSGTPDNTDASFLSIEVTGIDAGGLSASDSFEWTIVREDRPWQNPFLSIDVNHDGDASPIDALLIINELNLPQVTPPGSSQLPTPTSQQKPPPFLDVNGDRVVAPVDVLLVINHLNGVPSGEGPDGSDSYWASVARGFHDDERAITISRMTHQAGRRMELGCANS